MKGTVRIISGILKGKSVPFNVGRFDDADITPQKVKGALFSMIGENLASCTFVDLFAGSGQIGFEAVSRNAELTVMIEKDRPRFEFIKKFADDSDLGGRVLLLNMTASKGLSMLAGKGVRADIVFADPPYEKTRGVTEIYAPLLEMISESGILNQNPEVIIQHYSANELPASAAGLVRTGTKKYGTTSLTVYTPAVI